MVFQRSSKASPSLSLEARNEINDGAWVVLGLLCVESTGGDYSNGLLGMKKKHVRPISWIGSGVCCTRGNGG